MKVHIQRRSLLITPETPHDVAFIEDTLGLRVVDSYVVLRRVVVPVGDGVGGIIGLETIQLPESSDAEPKAENSVTLADGGPTTVDELVNAKNEDDDEDEDDGGSAPPAAGEVS